MIVHDRLVARSEITGLGGWEFKPEGACRGELCVPVVEAAEGMLDVVDIARRLGMPVVVDEEYGVWAIGPESGGHFLETAACPEIVLPDVDDNPFRLSSLLGTKVLLLAWASW